MQHGFSVEEPPARNSGDLAVVDIMFDKEDMDYYDVRRLGRIRKRFQRVVVLSSAMTIPDDLPVDAVIGHVLQGGRATQSPLRVFAGLDYSPVSAEFRSSWGSRAEVRRDIRRIFVGFGASRNLHGLERVLDALILWGFSGEVDVLLSPFHRRFEASLGRRKAGYRLRIHSNVRSVAPLMRRADVAFGTYGNITFEALCLGIPFLVVAVKEFQLTYARRLERQGLLICLGRDSELDAAKVVRTLKSLTQRKRETLSRRGRSSVDGLGIERIRRVIENEVLRVESALGREGD